MGSLFHKVWNERTMHTLLRTSRLKLSKRTAFHGGGGTQGGKLLFPAGPAVNHSEKNAKGALLREKASNDANNVYIQSTMQ